ncbi:MAG TPA: LAGLIDADG family homing endonuclease [Thermoanaerobaculia bacterium]|nr:LAGLIDADG family homing endonuclease [Thermoanaerobaculia bacterium]
MTKKCAINEAAFDELNSTASYFVGLLASDGCVGGSEPNRVSIKLAVDDIAMIRSLKAFLGSSATLSVQPRRGNSRPQAGIQVRSARLVQRLTRLGVGPHKSLTLVIRDKALLQSRHFWRGVIDGDGTVMIARHSKHERTYWYPRIQLVSGSEAFILQFSDFLARYDIRSTLGGTPTQAHGKDYMIYTCAVSNQSDTVRLAKLLYDGCGTLAIKRKKDVARQIARQYALAPKRKPVITATMKRQIVERYSGGQSSNAVAASLGLTTTAVTNTLKAANVPIRSRSGNHSTKRYSVAEVVNTYRNVRSTRRVAMLLGLCRDTVRAVLKAEGVVMNGPGERPQRLRAAV